MDSRRDDPLSTMAEAARFKGVCYGTVSRAVRAGRLPARRLGHQALIAAADLIAWTSLYSRAPHKYRRSSPDPGAPVAPVDAAWLERAGRERRVAGLAAALDARGPGLADRELRALAEGLSDREIGERLRVRPETVYSHMEHLFAKLGVDSRLQALVFAVRHGLVEFGDGAGR